MAENTGIPTRHFLVIGKDPDILKTVLRLLNDFKKAAYTAVGSTDIEEAKSLFDQQPIDLVLLTNGLDSNTTSELRTWFSGRKPEVKVLQHFGGGSGLLFNEITYSLQSKQTNHGTDRSA